MNKLRTGLLIALVSTIFCFIAIINGVRIPSGDSMSYLNCSISIVDRNEHSFPYFALNEEGKSILIFTEKNTIWPPATSATLAFFQNIGLSLLLSAQVFILIFNFLSIFLTFLFSIRLSKSIWASSIIAILLAFSWNFYFWISVSVMAEGLFISTTLISALLIIYQFDNERKSTHFSWIIVGLVIGFNYYIKSAAPAFILAALLSIFLFKGLWKNKFQRTILTSIGVFISAFPWFLRNINLGTIGSAGSGPTKHAIVESSTNLLRLLIPRHGSFTENKLIILMSILLILCGVLIVLIILKSYLNNKSILKNFVEKYKNDIGLQIPIYYIISFIIVMFISMYILRLAINIETRYWMEIIPFLAPFVYVFFSNQFENLNRKQYNIAKQISYVMLSIIGITNIFEIIRNEKKDWIILENEKTRKLICKKIQSTIHNKSNIRFISNRPVDFEITTGLTSWPLDSARIDTTSTYYMALFPLNNLNSISLSQKEMAIPDNYRYLSTVQHFKIYQKK